MGRKKGKQSGGFSSKALHTAYCNELKSNILEARPCRSRPVSSGYRNHFDQVDCRNSDNVRNRNSNFGSLQSHPITPDLPIIRSAPMVHQLRGLLMERRREDRIEDREMRLRNMQRNSSSRYANNSSIPTTSPSLLNFPGWIHFYKDIEEIKRDKMILWSKQRLNVHSQTKGTPTKFFSSLQSLCVKALAPSLHLYIEQWGVDHVHSILTTLSAHTLTLLSTFTECENHETIRVVGKHSHLDRLTLRLGKYSQTQGGGHIDVSVEDALLDLTPKAFIQQEYENNDLHHGIGNDEDLSWEDMLDNDQKEETYLTSLPSWNGCIHLKRLEIRDAPNLSASTIYQVLKNCTKITHLSFSDSLDTYTGIEVLLHPKNGILGENVRFSKIGQVLDLSFCNWLTDGILMQLLERLYVLYNEQIIDGCDSEHLVWNEEEQNDEEKYPTYSSSGLPALKVIRVYGCPRIDLEKCRLFCEKLFGITLLNVEKHDMHYINLYQGQLNH